MAFMPSASLTVRAQKGVLRSIQSECGVSPAFDPQQTLITAAPPFRQFMAIWDTGATNTVITQTVVDACGLQPTGMTQTHGVHGTASVETFLCNLRLPNGIGFAQVKVTRGVLVDNVSILLGMDIICRGDFSITNVNGTTVFSFRCPSCATIDYVEEHNRAQGPKPILKQGFQHRGGPGKRHR